MNKIYFEMSDGVIKVKGGEQRTVLGGGLYFSSAPSQIIFCKVFMRSFTIWAISMVNNKMVNKGLKVKLLFRKF